MWEQLKGIVFDATQASGFDSGFLGNLVAETYGVVVSVVLSFGIALWLDHGREVRRRRDHRRRAVTRWVQSHERMLEDVRNEGGQVPEDQRESVLLTRKARVEETKSDARAVWNDYREAFTKSNMTDAFDDYIAALDRLAKEVSRVVIWTPEVKELVKLSIEKIRKLARAVGSRAQLRRIQPELKRMEKAMLLGVESNEDLDSVMKTSFQ